MIETNFKHTDIGPIPHDWEVKRTVDLFDINAAGDLMRDNYSEVKTSCHIYPIYSNSNIDKGLYGYTSSPRYRKNSFTITGRGNLGIAEYRNTDFDAIIRLLVLSPKKGASSLFYSYYTNFAHPYEGSATSIPQLPIPNVAKGLIPVPPVGEQEAIGKALSDIDGLIEGLRKLIEKKRNIKQGAMSRLLSGSLRLPGFNKPWVTRTLGEIGHLIPNNSLSWEYLTNSGKVANIHYGHILTRFGAIVDVSYTQLPYVEKNSEARFLKGNMANDGDIIFADTAEDDTVGKAIELINIGDKHIVSGLHTFWFRPDVEFAHSFLGYAVNGEAFHSQIPLLATGTKVSSISKPNLLKLELHYPTDLAEQSAIAKVLTDMDAEIEGLEKKFAKYEQVKQGMMKQLLTGKIRLI